MRIIALIILLFSQPENDFTLKVTLDGMSSAEGNVNVGLYNSDKLFPKQNGISQHKIVKSSNKSVTVVFENLPKGSYAVAAYHDKNKNEELDKNFFGFPLENYGFSNNARHAMSPPSYKEAMIYLDSNLKINIMMK